MKKAVVSPLCSGLVIPGLGQIINQELKKGIFLLGAVLLLFIMGTVKLVGLIQAVFRGGGVNLSDADMIMARIRAQDLSSLWLIGAGFAVIWLYSVIDAFYRGRAMDREKGGSPTDARIPD